MPLPKHAELEEALWVCSVPSVRAELLTERQPPRGPSRRVPRPPRSTSTVAAEGRRARDREACALLADIGPFARRGALRARLPSVSAPSRPRCRRPVGAPSASASRQAEKRPRNEPAPIAGVTLGGACARINRELTARARSRPACAGGSVSSSPSRRVSRTAQGFRTRFHSVLHAHAGHGAFVLASPGSTVRKAWFGCPSIALDVGSLPLLRFAALDQDVVADKRRPRRCRSRPAA